MCFKKKISPSLIISENELAKLEVPKIELPKMEVPKINEEIEKYMDSLKSDLDPEKLIGDSASDYLSKVRE